MLASWMPVPPAACQVVCCHVPILINWSECWSESFKIEETDALLVCRATVTPFLANMTVGRDNFKWMLFGDDDTVSRGLLSMHLHRAAVLSDMRLPLLLLVWRWLLLHGAMLFGMTQPGMAYFSIAQLGASPGALIMLSCVCMIDHGSTAPTAGCLTLLRRCVTCGSLCCRCS